MNDMRTKQALLRKPDDTHLTPQEPTDERFKLLTPDELFQADLRHSPAYRQKTEF